MAEEKREHSLLSASSAHRWLTCTPSAVLERLEGVEECSVYAAEGTAAHELARLKLERFYDRITVEEYAKELENFIASPEFGRFYNPGFNEYVESYVEFVKDLTAKMEDYELGFEVRLDFSNIVPDGFGTADAIIVDYKTMKGYVIDLKFGQGVPVTAKDNPQLRLYAIGLLHVYRRLTSIEMIIFQPRLDSVSREEMSAIDLIEWGFGEVRPKAELAANGEGVLRPSESACRFCKLRGKCKARADSQLTTAQREFEIIDHRSTLVQSLNPAQLANILDVAPLFVDWYKDVQAFALGQLIAGEKIPGYKLVEGRSNRIITDEEKVKEILLGVGFTEDEIMKPRTTQGISTLEGIVGKKLFGELCGDYIIKPAGKLTMAPVSDRRPEVSTLAIAQCDFNSVEEEN